MMVVSRLTHRTIWIALVLSGTHALAQLQDPTLPVSDQIIVQVADPFGIDDFMPLLLGQVPSAQVIDASLASRKIYLIATPGINEPAFGDYMEATWVNSTPSVPNPNRP